IEARSAQDLYSTTFQLHDRSWNQRRKYYMFMAGTVSSALAALSELGLGNGLLYLLARMLERLSAGRIRLFKYYFVAQPVPTKPLAEVPKQSKTRIRQVTVGDAIISQFPRPPEVI